MTVSRGQPPGSDDGRRERENMNKNIKIENGKIYAESKLCERKDTFEIVKKIPTNFFVWNIGENMGLDEYIPLAEDLKPNDKEKFEKLEEKLSEKGITKKEWLNGKVDEEIGN